MTTTTLTNPRLDSLSAASILREPTAEAKPMVLPVPASPLPDANDPAPPNNGPRPASPCPDQLPAETQSSCVGASPSADQIPLDTQPLNVGAQLTGNQITSDTHPARVARELLFCSAFLDDIEQLRIATENRARALQAEGLDITAYQGQADALANLEHQAILALQKAVRRHPLGSWIKQTIGIGEKQGARLIACFGPNGPAWNDRDNRPRRGPAELWAYSGFHTLPPASTSAPAMPKGQPSAWVAAKRHKGVRSNWNANAKMRAWLCAESCIKQANSPYRTIYDHARAKHADAIHQHDCVRCGPQGKPAPAGSPLSDGHKHARALRETAKAILKDLWTAARKTEAN